MNKNIVFSILVTAFVAGGLGFFGGMKYQESKIPNFPSNTFQGGNLPDRQFGQNNAQDRTNGFLPTSGKIIDKDEESITVETADGGSKIILLTDTSAINKTESGSPDDLSEGLEVVVFGQENSDGSITAQNIQIGDNFQRGLEPNGN